MPSGFTTVKSSIYPDGMPSGFTTGPPAKNPGLSVLSGN